MFDVQEQIIRPPKVDQLSYTDARKIVSSLLGEIETTFDDKFEVLPGKEKEAAVIFENVSDLVNKVLGEPSAWPLYHEITPSLMTELQQRWDYAVKKGDQVLALASTPRIFNQRKEYAEGIAKALLEHGKKNPNERAQWNAFAARALVLLSPLTPRMGLWPIPTAANLKLVHEMISPYSIGLTEVSTFADTAEMVHRLGRRTLDDPIFR